MKSPARRISVAPLTAATFLLTVVSASAQFQSFGGPRPTDLPSHPRAQPPIIAPVAVAPAASDSSELAEVVAALEARVAALEARAHSTPTPPAIPHGGPGTLADADPLLITTDSIPVSAPAYPGPADAVVPLDTAAPVAEVVPAVETEPTSEELEEVEAALAEAQRRLAETESRIADLESREREILERLDTAMTDAIDRQSEIAAMAQAETQRLEEIRQSQAGKIDVGMMIENVDRTLSSMDLPTLISGVQHTLLSLDEFMDLGAADVADQMAISMEEMNVGRNLIQLGENFEGMNLGEMLLGMAEQYRGVAVPDQIGQLVQMANQFGAMGFVRMGQNSLKNVNAAAFLMPMAQQAQQFNPCEMMFALSEQAPGEFLPAVCTGIGHGIEGLDAGLCLEILAGSLEPLSARALLDTVEVALKGGDLGQVFETLGNALVDIDAGMILIEMGEALEDVHAGTVMEYVAAELEGMTFSECVCEVEDGLVALGLGSPGMTAAMAQSGQELAALQLPERIGALQQTSSQLRYFVDTMRSELGLMTSSERDGDDSPYTFLTSEPTPVDEAVEQELVFDDFGPTDVAVPQPVNPEVEKLERVVASLRERGFDDDHPAVMKALQKLDAARASDAR